MKYIRIEIVNAKCINRNRSLGLVKHRSGYRITFPNGEIVTHYYYSDAQAVGHAIQLCIAKYEDYNQLIVERIEQ